MDDDITLLSVHGTKVRVKHLVNLVHGGEIALTLFTIGTILFSSSSAESIEEVGIEGLQTLISESGELRVLVIASVVVVALFVANWVVTSRLIEMNARNADNLVDHWQSRCEALNRRVDELEHRETTALQRANQACERLRLENEKLNRENFELKLQIQSELNNSPARSWLPWQ